jgi:hypothetical protein
MCGCKDGVCQKLVYPEFVEQRGKVDGPRKARRGHPIDVEQTLQRVQTFDHFTPTLKKIHLAQTVIEITLGLGRNPRVAITFILQSLKHIYHKTIKK